MKNYTKNLNCIFCILALMLGLFLITNKTTAQTMSQGSNSPVWVLSVDGMCWTCPGATWANNTKVEQLDSIYSYATLKPYGTCSYENCYYSREFTPSEYLFNIPVNATITGIEVEVFKKASSDSAVVDDLVQLMNDDTAVGVSHAQPSFWSNRNASYLYGSSTDLWGYNWTPQEINSNYFGVWFTAENKSTTQQKAYVDWIGVTVYYTLTTTGITTISSSTSSNNISVQYGIADNNLILSTDFDESIASSTITVMDILGQVQFKKELSNLPRGNSKNIIATSPMNPGVYLVQFSGGGKNIIKKLIVNK
jgi:hypothetical protein